MLTITITFAILVALWGFSGTIAAHAKRVLVQAKPRTRPATPPRPASVRTSAPRTRRTRPVASA
jgi:hypothetical protein